MRVVYVWEAYHQFTEQKNDEMQVKFELWIFILLGNSSNIFLKYHSNHAFITI